MLHNSHMKRFQKEAIIKDLAKKMVFLVGPRQAGKTWLAKSIAKQFRQPVYLNYDSVDDQAIIDAKSWLEEIDLLILDELHKKPNWKNYLKGLYDTKQPHQSILVTGSARLGVYQAMGDSLAGRFYLHHLLPFSPAEVAKIHEKVDLNRFMLNSGFPEPYLSDSESEVKRWRMQYIDSLIRTDVLEFENIKNIRAMRLVVELLRKKVGSPVSFQSIAEDVNVSINTVKRYIEVLEALYIIFRVTPFSNNIARSLLKAPKIYFFDSGFVRGDKGVVFENLVASCLLKFVYAKRDYQGENYKLHYLRTKEGKEVDFALVCDETVEELVEVKFSDTHLSEPLRYFSEKYDLKACQLVKTIKHETQQDNIRILRAENYLKGLGL